MVRYANNFADGQLHYHSCPECYEDKPCYMGCAHEPDLDDPPSDPRGRRFGACCDSAVCDDCLRAEEMKHDREYEALARARAATEDDPVGSEFCRCLEKSRRVFWKWIEGFDEIRAAQTDATEALLLWRIGDGHGASGRALHAAMVDPMSWASFDAAITERLYPKERR